jgi:S1-C subfamily serine protease
MLKLVSGLIFLGLFIVFLTLNTSVTQLGSGFLIGDHVFTYHQLVKTAKILNIKFPNEDDIEANLVFSDPTHNLALLKLKEAPKVKTLPLMLSAKGMSPQNESVFTLGYPWTNTMEDKHALKEGSTLVDTASVLIKLDMDLDPVHSGSPLFNTNQEVVGMVLLGDHAMSVFPVTASEHFAIPRMWMAKVLKEVGVDANTREMPNLSKEEFILKSRNNIVLIEAK